METQPAVEVELVDSHNHVITDASSLVTLSIGGINASNPITGNTAQTVGGGIDNEGGSLTLVDSVIGNNTAGEAPVIRVTTQDKVTLPASPQSGKSNGGGIENAGGVLLVIRSVVTNNFADGLGGGIDQETAETTITGSTISGNHAASDGGGLSTDGGNVTITGSTFSGNSSGADGGGLVNAGRLVLINSTISGNSAIQDGGGLFNLGGTDEEGGITNCTFTGNSAAEGGALYLFEDASKLTFYNTIVANSPRGSNYVAGLQSGNERPPKSGGFNISSDRSLSQVFTNTGDLNNTDPRLDVLANNGGLTLTHDLLLGSPARDSAGPGGPTADQRGVARPQGAGIDRGAVESRRTAERVADLGITVVDSPDPVMVGSNHFAP